MSTKPRTNAALALHEKRYAPFKVHAVMRALSELGVDIKLLLAGSGLSPAEASNAQTRISVHQFIVVCRNAGRLSPEAGWAALVGGGMRLTDYGMYGYALACAESMRGACELAVRYHGLATPVIRIAFEVEHDVASWVLPTLDEAALPDVDTDLFRALLEMQLGTHVSLTKHVMGAWCMPARANFALPRPRYAGLLERVLECTVAFDQPRTQVDYPAEWLDRTPQFANPIAATQVSAACAKLLEDHKWSSGMSRRVYAELTRTPGRFPSIDEIAAGLCINARTLRRRLNEEGTTYLELLASLRQALAVDYLSTSFLEVDDIAAALGFSDAASFRHAFKRWTGRTPNEYRAGAGTAGAGTG